MSSREKNKLLLGVFTLLLLSSTANAQDGVTRMCSLFDTDYSDTRIELGCRLIIEQPATFPVPVHEGNASIWHLAEVLGWLDRRGGYQIDAGMVETARVALAVNVAKETMRHPVSGRGDMERLTT